MNTTAKIALKLIPDGRRVLTKIFGNREVLAYVTTAEKKHSAKRLFFSTIFTEDLQIFCA